MLAARRSSLRSNLAHAGPYKKPAPLVSSLSPRSQLPSMSPVPTFNSFAFAPYIGVSLFLRIFAIFRNTFQCVIPDNPLFYWLFNSRNPLWHDVEGAHISFAPFVLVTIYNIMVTGPFYMLGAPSRNIAEGKATLASRDMLKGKSDLAVLSPLPLPWSIIPHSSHTPGPQVVSPSYSHSSSKTTRATPFRTLRWTPGTLTPEANTTSNHTRSAGR